MKTYKVGVIGTGMICHIYIDNIANLYNRQALTDFINGLF